MSCCDSLEVLHKAKKPLQQICCIGFTAVALVAVALEIMQLFFGSIATATSCCINNIMQRLSLQRLRSDAIYTEIAKALNRCIKLDATVNK